MDSVDKSADKLRKKRPDLEKPELKLLSEEPDPDILEFEIEEPVKVKR